MRHGVGGFGEIGGWLVAGVAVPEGVVGGDFAFGLGEEDLAVVDEKNEKKDAGHAVVAKFCKSLMITCLNALFDGRNLVR